MAENGNTYTIKDNGELGSVKIADEVVAVIAALAATEVKGVSSLSGGITGSMVARKGIKALSKGVRVTVEEGKVRVELLLNLAYGYSIPNVGKEVQKKVKTSIENMTSLEVTEVNIRVADVAVNEE